MLSLVSVSVCLVLVETFFAVRYDKVRERMESGKTGDIFCTRKSEYPELIYTRIPGKCGANSQGYRDNEYAIDKPEGVYRIVVIGDSVADGHGLEMKHSFGKVLETMLNPGPEGEARKVEVVLLALGGYSTSQELFLLEHEAFRYSPDLIVWSYVLNDPAHPIYRGASGEVGSYHYEPRFHTVHFVYDKLFKIIEKFKGLGCEEEYHALLHCAYWDQVESSIMTIAALSSQHQVPVVLLIHPIIEENGSYDSYPLTALHGKLSSTASSAGLQVLDLLDAYSDHDPMAITLPSDRWHDIWHPNEQGHRITATALRDFMQREGLLAAQTGGD